MIRKLSLLPFFIFSSAFSQEKYEDSIKNIIEKDFVSIKAMDFRNLVPYKAEKGMGYLNSKNNKLVVKPNYYQLDFAKPNLRGNYNDIAYFEINSRTKKMEVFLQNWRIFEESPKEGPIKKGYAKGFYVSNNSIFSFSHTYTYCPQLFKYKNQDFAIAIKDNAYAVINPDGETLKNLDFNYSHLDLIDSGNDNIWFKYKTLSGELGFINMNGEKKLINDIISNSRSQTEGYFSFVDSEHSVRRKYYGYSIESNDESYGVLDLLTMTWLIKPQKLFKIEEINYATDQNLSEKYDVEDRKNLKFYFLVSDKEKETSYYIDDQLKKYVLKK
ncbi:hypothetical protein [Chryseobacterium vrystaatense]|uniref:Uncharacterized protein n=1 Tax=Chryseobacterium vrystaatense TaxID=307480 RepID=A0A1M5D191_9FLAO|nr:hypothetical protein [Chryseobacterium vrystaatense]SHF60684.1 hypothetical protein SAMN02787073_2443 [Chryseobacterium vrystaatense]